MPFSIVCENCKKQNEPVIDPKTEKVYCSLCDKEMNNITYFAKSQMKAIKQFREKSTSSYSVKCDKCNREGEPKLLNGEVVCSNCKKKLDKLSPIFINMLKEQLRKGHSII
jgi:protein-arginine kinase activator protein McsA